MAGNCLSQHWWWIPLAVLSACGPQSRADRAVPYAYSSDRSRPGQGQTRAEIALFLRERCDRPLNSTAIHDTVGRAAGRDGELFIALVPKSLTCEARSWGLGALIQVLGQSTTKAVIAALDSATCEVAAKLAHLWSKPLLTWSCPLMDLEDRQVSSIVRLSPSLPSVAQAVAEMFSHLRWKSLVIISTDDEPWSSLDKATVGAFRSIGAIPRYRSVLPRGATLEQIRRTVRSLYAVAHRAIVLCLPLVGNETIGRVLVELDVLRPAHAVNSAIVIVHPEDDDLLLPLRERSSGEPYSDAAAHDGLERRRVSPPSPRRFVLPDNLGKATLDKLLAVTPHDRTYNVQNIYNGSEETVVATSLLDRINESLYVLLRDNASINSYGNKMYTYALLDWQGDGWRPILTVVEQEDRLTVERLATQAVAFVKQRGNDYAACGGAGDDDGDDNDNDSEDNDNDCRDEQAETPLRTTHIVAIIFGSLLFTFAAITVVVFIRRHLTKRRMSKGPYKIILTASDFVFPQMPQVDSRTVDEGIEAMLCCWLQQLQEFGGPEVEKPDLLQLGSVSSLRPYLQTGTGNVPRHTFFKDPRARYNGDLVQLKELPCQGSFELKGKAMDVLVTIHGLRHENLNPLIGCLNEPTRPCLVSEYCSRGSLEDVLVQDEIKLDWSFRLSLLTDLVRGMRYLHGTPIRVHGYLTSRNCVIDARWVLKVTDYGLPAFYEAQNIVPPSKTARDLLWTAPELLRRANLRKEGTQPGDVYSFGIIMQEVVVRGEPFCMLALSPEDIIEKVMRPPPLIRPSVSKGAAPPEAINIMRQCWAEAADMRPDFNDVHDLFKKLNHGRKVNFVDTMFQMLEKYSNNLEELIRERTEQLDMEKKKTEQLLNRMLPGSVAEKLKLGMPVDPEEFREVTIYFSDIVGFTTISAYSTPFQVVDLLNDLYTCFDATINAYTVYKVETIGDAYMVVGGCPVRIADHASQIATMALDLLHQSGKFKLKHLPRTQLRLRIGLHTGPCCAGVVGLTMPRYCLFGDTVNTASRMESTGAPWRIHLSQATRDRLNQAGGYRIEYRGPTDVKGKGKMPTYWLLGKQGFDKELPTPPPLGENHGLDESVIIGSLASQDRPEPRSVHRTIERTKNVDYDGDVDGVATVVPVESKDDDAVNSEDEASKKQQQQQQQQKPSSDTRRKVAVSVHDERGVVHHARSLNTTSEYSEFAEFLGRATSSKDALDVRVTEHGNGGVCKSALGDAQTGTPPIATGQELASALLGSSTSSLASISSSVTMPFRPTAAGRHRRIAGCIDENDLSTPYNHYRCLSPNEHTGKSSGCRLLKRQFSLDRADEPPALLPTRLVIPEQSLPGQRERERSNVQPRIFKQNSAGAANDLERIEEVPATPGPHLQSYRHAASVSLSVESLSLR